MSYLLLFSLRFCPLGRQHSAHTDQPVKTHDYVASLVEEDQEPVGYETFLTLYTSVTQSASILGIFRTVGVQTLLQQLG